MPSLKYGRPVQSSWAGMKEGRAKVFISETEVHAGLVGSTCQAPASVPTLTDQRSTPQAMTRPTRAAATRTAKAKTTTRAVRLTRDAFMIGLFVIGVTGSQRQCCEE